MESKNSFSLDLADEEMRKLFVGKQPGDAITLETTFIVSEVSQTMVTGRISEVAPIAGESEGMEQEEADESEDGPVPAAAVLLTKPTKK